MPKNIFFTPGPAQLFHTVPQHFQNALAENIGSISHRGNKFQDIYKLLKERLKELLSLPDHYQVFVTGSATEVWERIVQNLVVAHSHHFVNGSFSARFYEIARDYNLSSTKTEAGLGSEFSSFEVPADAELIAVTLNETSTGYQFGQENLKKLRAAHPDKLIALDVVSIAPAVPIDFTLVDTAYFSVQKCFGLPAGLGIWIVNEKCLEKSEQKAKSQTIGSYHSLPSLVKNGAKNQTPETPNVLYMHVLSEVVQDMLNRGARQIHNETIYKSELMYRAFDEHPKLSAFISHKPNRSRTVCVAQVAGGNEAILSQFASRGMILGKGYGPFKEGHIRVANFPTHSKELFEMLVDHLNNY